VTPACTRFPEVPVARVAYRHRRDYSTGSGGNRQKPRRLGSLMAV
jgi:hypothetical protein